MNTSILVHLATLELACHAGGRGVRGPSLPCPKCLQTGGSRASEREKSVIDLDRLLPATETGRRTAGVRRLHR